MGQTTGGIDPVSLASSGLQFLGGSIQAIAGGIREKKALKALEKLQTPTYTANQSIMDYYNKALSRYNVDPYSTAMYKLQNQNVMRGTAQGLRALQDRRSALGGVSSLVQAQNDSMLKAGAMAENQLDQRFNQLGAATGMRAREERAAWEQNELAPYEKRYNLLAAKASGGAQMMNAGLQNMFGGASNAASIYQAQKTYGQ